MLARQARSNLLNRASERHQRPWLQCRRALHQLMRLKEGSVRGFKRTAYDEAKPVLFPEGHFHYMPALSKWFQNTETEHVPQTRVINTDYLMQHGDITVPVELTTRESFMRAPFPLRMFIEASQPSQDMQRLAYIAQASVSDLPEPLRNDLPTPDFVIQTGKGDVYDASIWLGLAPTYTPLHRDPNPNIFVQLAGTKRVRILPPAVGAAVFAHVQRSIGGSARATMRGDEMMQGREKAALEKAVWDTVSAEPWHEDLIECEVSAGDGLFIPKGWWHSIKGVGSGMTGSVNWWFR